MQQLFDMDEDEDLLVFNDEMMKRSKKALINYIVRLQLAYTQILGAGANLDVLKARINALEKESKEQE